MMNYTKIFFLVFFGSILLLSSISANIGIADALKSKGVTNTKYGKATSAIVCGDQLCSEVKTPSRGTIVQQSAGPPMVDLHSFKFNSGEGVAFDAINNGYLNLKGDYDSMKIDSPDTDVLDSLTVSAWVNPNFSKSFAEYSIVSKENSFNLSVDNRNFPNTSVNFSIFDGATWTTAKSTDPIYPGWINVAGVFDDGFVKVYLNGHLAGTTKLKPTTTVDSSGQIVSKVIDRLESNSDLVIGSYVISTRMTDGLKETQQFIGGIDDVEVIADVLDQTELFFDFTDGLSNYKSRISETPSNDDSNLFN